LEDGLQISEYRKRDDYSVVLKVVKRLREADFQSGEFPTGIFRSRGGNLWLT
jgi:hypothetical protein